MEKLAELLLSDVRLMAEYEGKPIHQAALVALCEYWKKGHSLGELPWFVLNKSQRILRLENFKRAA